MKFRAWLIFANPLPRAVGRGLSVSQTTGDSSAAGVTGVPPLIRFSNIATDADGKSRSS